MQCHYSFLIVFALLLLLKVSSIECQTPPYSLTKTERDVNQLTLQCMGTLGSIVSNAVFYRNGVLNTSDECFNSSVSIATNKLRFTISPKCDGHYMCGARNGSGVVLSKPITIYAYPVKIGSDRNITGEVGKSITLPCGFVHSPINSYTTKWFKILGSMRDEIATYDGEIHDHIINNLQLMDEAFYRCQIRPKFPSSVFDPSNGPYLNLTVNETYRSPIITTGLIIVNNSDGSSELRVNTIGTNLQYQWSINNTVVNGTTQRVVKNDERHLKLNGRWNGTLKVEYLVWNNDYSGIRHEGKQEFVVSPYYIECSMKLLDLESPQGIAIITMVTVLIVSFGFNVIFCIFLAKKTCCKRKQEESTNGGDLSIPQEHHPSLTTQLSTMSNSKMVQCINLLRQVSGEMSITLSTPSEKMQVKHSTSQSSSTSSEAKHANPMANILVEVAKTISEFEHTDIELLNGVVIVLQSVTRLAQLRQCHTALRNMAIQIMEQIERIKYNVPTATLMKHSLSDPAVVNKRPQPSDTGYQGLEEQSSSKDQSEVYVADSGVNDQLPLRAINSKIQMDDHEPQEEEEERELTDEEKDDLMKLLNAMSSQLEPFLKMD